MAPVITIENLRKVFVVPRTKQSVLAIDGFSLELAQGEFVSLAGPSGCGKSTVLNIVAGLDAPTSGRVVMEGAVVAGPSADRGMVFQDYALFPWKTIKENVGFGLRYGPRSSKVGRKEREAIVQTYIELVGLQGFENRYPHELSGGMRQRVMLAMALINRPQVLIADEPTTALDVTVQAQILEVIGEQRAERNMSLILVTHDLGVVAGHTDHIVVMYAGKVVESAPTRTLFADMKMPYTKSLMRSIPKIEDASHTRLMAIPGRPPDLVNPPKGCRFAPRCAYARDKCHDHEPPLTPAASSDHVYACWYPVGSPEFEERDAEIVTQLAIAAGAR
jgi:peptide/nickel transport system ATP-binding protein